LNESIAIADKLFCTFEQTIGYMIHIKIVLLLCIIFINQNIYSQTFIGPYIGIDASRIFDYDSSTAYETNISLLSEGFSNISPALGLKIRKIITDNVFLSVSTEYTYKKIPAYNFKGIARIEYLGFNYFRNNASLHGNIKSFAIGIGINYNLLTNISNIYHNNIKSNIVQQVDETALKFTVSHRIKNFNIEGYLIQGLNYPSDPEENIHLNKITSIGINIGCDLKL